jgi:parallel beta-helix repeat protein
MLILSTLLGTMIFFSDEVESNTVILGGTITTDTTWTLAGSPYWIEGDVYVEKRANLTIEAGVEVSFNGYYKLCIGNGTLLANGAPGNKIWFTSNLSSLKEENWDGIKVNSTGRIDLSYCNVTYANFAIEIDSANNNSIKFSEITINRRGISISLSYNNTILNNNISDNANIGVFISESSETYINNNTVNDNNWNGLHIYSSNHNTIINN